MRLLQSLLRVFFKLLYHQFAWTYDLVAGVVSLGRWKDWVQTALPYIHGRVLEIGHGPGHLQATMHKRGLLAFGLDESRQMGRQSMRLLKRKGFPANLTCGLAQHLPFSDAVFDTVTATFPSEYIFALETLAEIRRVLAQGGNLVILPSAWITGKGLLKGLARELFAVTGQAGPIEATIHAIKARLWASGFDFRYELVETAGSRVLIVIANPKVQG